VRAFLLKRAQNYFFLMNILPFRNNFDHLQFGKFQNYFGFLDLNEYLCVKVIVK